MALSAQQSLQQYGTTAYTGWGETEAMYDARAKGIGNGGSNSNYSADSILGSAINSITQYIQPQTPYSQVNPFSFDEALAKEASTAEYSPYYDNLLSQYTQQVETNKSRSREDLTNTLNQLSAGKEYYQGTQRTLLDRAIDQTNKGYAGNGLFFSGAKQKDINQLTTDYNTNQNAYNQQYGFATQGAQTQNKRTQEDLTTGLNQYTTNIGNEKQFAIQQGVLQRQSEAMNQYLAGEQQYYSRGLYPTGTA